MVIREKKVFLSGGAGFIGSHLVERLASKNRVVVFDDGSRNTLGYLKRSRRWKLEVIKGDILDLPSVQAALKGAQIVIHLAAITGVPNYYHNPIQTMKVNFLGTLNLLEAAKFHKLEHFIYFSSSEVYGPHAFQAEEEAFTSQGPPGQLRWTYNVSKVAGEHLAMAYYAEHNLSITCLRPFNVYGPRQVGEGAIAILIRKALEGEPLPVHGDGSQIRAWCFVSDMVEATLLAIAREEAKGRCFNIGNPAACLTSLELARKIKSLTRSRSRIFFAPPPQEEVRVRVPCIHLASRLLGYNPQVDLEEGLRRTIRWYQSIS